MGDDLIDAYLSHDTADAGFPRPLVEAIRRSRRYPRPTQFDYLHVRLLLSDLAAVLGTIASGASEVLDLYCGARPYDDLLPPGARVTGFDIESNPYGVADVVSNGFLPFPDESFDVVMCIGGFQYVADPRHGVTEIRRVLRRRGLVVIGVPLVWEYDRTSLEHRFTGPELAALFAGWDEIQVRENGGRAVSWATVTGSLINLLEWRARRGRRLRPFLRPVFETAYLVVNSMGTLLDRAERRYVHSPMTLPASLLLSARRPTE